MVILIHFVKRGKDENHDYSMFFSKIQSYHDAVKISDSCWMFGSDEDCKDVRTSLAGYLQFDDELLVTQMVNYAGRNLRCGQQQLINVMKHIND